jgi:hypothetical protein
MAASHGVEADLAQPALEQQCRDFDPNTGNTDGRYWEKTAELRQACPVFVSEQMDGFTAVRGQGGGGLPRC